MEYEDEDEDEDEDVSADADADWNYYIQTFHIYTHMSADPDERESRREKRREPYVFPFAGKTYYPVPDDDCV